MAVFELSYQGRDGWSGSEGGWLSATDESTNKQSRICAVNGSIDQATICPASLAHGASVRSWNSNVNQIMSV